MRWKAWHSGMACMVWLPTTIMKPIRKLMADTDTWREGGGGGGGHQHQLTSTRPGPYTPHHALMLMTDRHLGVRG